MHVTKLKQPIHAYLKQNVHYTFSGMNYQPAFLNLLLELGGVDRIMFSADYPYQSMPWARAFLDQIPATAAEPCSASNTPSTAPVRRNRSSISLLRWS